MANETNHKHYTLNAETEATVEGQADIIQQIADQIDQPTTSPLLHFQNIAEVIEFALDETQAELSEDIAAVEGSQADDYTDDEWEELLFLRSDVKHVLAHVLKIQAEAVSDQQSDQ